MLAEISWVIRPPSLRVWHYVIVLQPRALRAPLSIGADEGALIAVAPLDLGTHALWDVPAPALRPQANWPRSNHSGRLDPLEQGFERLTQDILEAPLRVLVPKQLFRTP